MEEAIALPDWINSTETTKSIENLAQLRQPEQFLVGCNVSSCENRYSAKN
jgi:hypothetical protein